MNKPLTDAEMRDWSKEQWDKCVTRADILRLADKHATLTAGWMFSVPDMEDFYRHAYEAGFNAGIEDGIDRILKKIKEHTNK